MIRFCKVLLTFKERLPTKTDTFNRRMKDMALAKLTSVKYQLSAKCDSKPSRSSSVEHQENAREKSGTKNKLTQKRLERFERTGNGEKQNTRNS